MDKEKRRCKMPSPTSGACFHAAAGIPSGPGDMDATLDMWRAKRAGEDKTGESKVSEGRREERNVGVAE